MTRLYLLWITLMIMATAWSVVLFHFVFSSEHHLLSSANQHRVNDLSFVSRNRNINARKRSESKTNNDQRTTSILNRDNTLTHWKNVANSDNFQSHYTDDFGKDWCRIRQARLDWQAQLGSCAKQTKWGSKYVGWGIHNRTDASKSLIIKWDIRPAGEFSKFFIQSKTSSNETKNFGGDAWRIHITGTASVSATVFDHRNGTYEVVFLLMESGSYELQIFLDYTLCDGLKDPPDDWYKKGNIQGKNQPDGTLKEDSPYIMQPFGDGKPIMMNILKPRYSKGIQSALDHTRRQFLEQKENNEHILCNQGCRSLMWDGYGRWIDDTWKPFVKDFEAKSEHHTKEGILWIYGDSVSKMFKEALTTGKFYEVCEKIFKLCRITYSWVYNMNGYVRGNGKEPIPDGIDYDHHRVMNEIKKVLYDKRMDEHSVLLLNWGIHFAAAVNFSNYQRLIDEFIETVKLGRMRGRFKGKIIWRTTTAIFRERYPNPHRDVRRFLTFPRILLYNAYAVSAMCTAGIEVIDVYPMSDSFPQGTLSKNDPVHYERRAFESVEALIHRKFKSNKHVMRLITDFT